MQAAIPAVTANYTTVSINKYQFNLSGLYSHLIFVTPTVGLP